MDTPSTPPKILLYDLETTHNLVAAFRLFNDGYLPHENILQERYIVCASWKWLGEKEVHAVSVLDHPKRFHKDHSDDYHVVETLYQVFQDADVIVAHNGDQYDSKYLAGRALIHGFKPLPPVQQIDTLKIARDKFLLNSNRLDYLGRLLGIGKKIKTDNELWLKVLEGDPEAIEKMVEYNKYDVELLEGVFLKLRPYMPNYVNRQLFDTGTGQCPRCGGHHIQARGTRRAQTQVYQQYQCQDCGGWFRDRKSVGHSQVRLL